MGTETPGRRPALFRPRRLNPIQGALLCAGAVLAACLFGILGLYLGAQRSLKSQMHAELSNVASIAARFVDPAAHAAFRSRDQEKDSAYLAALDPLARILAADPSLKFIYTMVTGPDGIRFVLDPTPEGDTDGDGVDDKSHILQPYPDASAACRRAFATGLPTVDQEPYTDAWGSFYSAYAPIRDANGNLAAVLGVDMRAETLQANLQGLRAKARTGIGISIVLALAACMGAWLALRKRHRDAEEAKRLLADLELARALADGANAAKSEFLSVMSHEIRTPLNGMIGCASMLEAEGLQGEPARLAATIRESGDLLLNLVNDILDFSRIESRGVELAESPFDLAAEIAWVASLLGPRAQEKGLGFSTDYPPDLPRRFLGDSTRIRQVLLNLVGNAIKFTDAGKVGIEADAAPGGPPGAIRVSVRDSGIGLGEGGAARLFQPFTQAEASSRRRFGGTGLGLSICKRLVEAMGGAISAEPNPGGGSVFRFTLPLASDPYLESPGPKPPAPGPEAAAGPLGLKVLVVEDNQVNRMVMGKMLERLGCACVFARDGAEGVRAAGAETFDVILMDCRMPVMDGYESARAIRAPGGRNAGTPIVALTANAAREDRDLCLASGMNGFLGKPVRLQDLAAALSRARD